MTRPSSAHLAQSASLWPAPHDYGTDSSSLDLLGDSADCRSISAYITVSDAAGRVLFRRLATDDEVMSALEAAHTAECEAQAVMERLAQSRGEQRAARDNSVG